MPFGTISKTPNSFTKIVHSRAQTHPFLKCLSNSTIQTLTKPNLSSLRLPSGPLSRLSPPLRTLIRTRHHRPSTSSATQSTTINRLYLPHPSATEVATTAALDTWTQCSTETKTASICTPVPGMHLERLLLSSLAPIVELGILSRIYRFSKGKSVSKSKSIGIISSRGLMTALIGKWMAVRVRMNSKLIRIKTYQFKTLGKLRSLQTLTVTNRI